MSDTLDTRPQESWWLDTELLAPDPDLSELFAEVDHILRQALRTAVSLHESVKAR